MSEVRTSNRKTRVGMVTSDKMDKTCIITITHRFRHPMYGKYVKRISKLMVHDQDNACGIGDTVRIIETRPLSHDKRWRLLEIVEKAK